MGVDARKDSNVKLRMEKTGVTTSGKKLGNNCRNRSSYWGLLCQEMDISSYLILFKAVTPLGSGKRMGLGNVVTKEALTVTTVLGIMKRSILTNMTMEAEVQERNVGRAITTNKNT